MAEVQDIPLPQAAIRLLQKQDPTRVVILVRNKSPFHSLEPSAIVQQACATLRVDPIQSRAKLLTVMHEHRLDVLGMDLWYDGYDWALAHHPVDLPVLVVDYGKRLSCVKVAGTKFRKEANDQVARQHRVHGWDAKPPYFVDGTAAARIYYNPRLVKHTLPDGTVERMVKTPPPGSVSAYPPYDVERPKGSTEKISTEKGSAEKGSAEKGSAEKGGRGSSTCDEATAS